MRDDNVTGSNATSLFSYFGVRFENEEWNNYNDELVQVEHISD